MIRLLSMDNQLIIVSVSDILMLKEKGNKVEVFLKGCGISFISKLSIEVINEELVSKGCLEKKCLNHIRRT